MGTEDSFPEGPVWVGGEKVSTIDPEIQKSDYFPLL